MSRESLADIAARYGQDSAFGHKDYQMAQKAGYSNNQIKSWLDQDISRLHVNNRKGGISGLYDEISANTVDLNKRVDIDRGESESTKARRAEEARRKAAAASKQKAAQQAKARQAEEARRKAAAASKQKSSQVNSEIGNDTSVNKATIKINNRSEAKDRAQGHINNISNNVEQNVGNKGDFTTTIGNKNTINNSQIGNDKSESEAKIEIDNYALDLAKNYKNKGNTDISNEVTQNVGNKGNFTTKIGDGNTFNGSNIGNDYSFNQGKVNFSNSFY